MSRISPDAEFDLFLTLFPLSFLITCCLMLLLPVCLPVCWWLGKWIDLWLWLPKRPVTLSACCLLLGANTFLLLLLFLSLFYAITVIVSDPLRTLILLYCLVEFLPVTRPAYFYLGLICSHIPWFCKSPWSLCLMDSGFSSSAGVKRSFSCDWRKGFWREDFGLVLVRVIFLLGWKCWLELVLH